MNLVTCCSRQCDGDDCLDRQYRCAQVSLRTVNATYNATCRFQLNTVRLAPLLLERLLAIRKAVTDSMLQVIEAYPNWPVYADVFEHPLLRLAFRCPTWSDMTSVDTVTQRRENWSSACGQPHYCYRPYYPTARFRSPSSYMVSDEPFPDRLRPMSC